MTTKTLPTLLILLWSLCAQAQGTLMTSVVNGDIEIENCARINDRETQFGPAIYGEELVFLTRPKRGNVDPITRQTYYKLFRSPISRDGLPGNPRPFSVELNSNYNEGPVSFTQEDRVIFLTRTQQRDGTTVEDINGKVNLGIYSAYRAEYDWAGIRPLPFNGKNFSNQHPSVTKDGRRVFFASNREGGYGGYDIYFSDYWEGRWSRAINLGPEINTEGNEAFPYIHPSGRLFFASDGHGGQGGYDLFMMNLSGRRWGDLINLPSPVNSPGDDIGITLTNDGNRAYLVSNRAAGKGQDDIYLLRLKRGLTSLRGPEIDGETFTLYDGATSRRVSNALVWFTEVDPAGRLPASFYSFKLEERNGEKQIVPATLPVGKLPSTALRTDREGSLRLELTAGKTYELWVHKNGYAPEYLRFVYTRDGPSRPLAVTLRPNNCRLVSGRITDRNGGGVEAVPVQFRPEGCNSGTVSTITDMAGYYEICLSPDCGFLIAAGRPGYETAVVRLPVDQLTGVEHPVFDVSLKPEGNISRHGVNSVDALLPLPGLNFFDATAILQEELSGDIDLLQRLLEDRPDIQLMLIAHTDGPKTPELLVRLGEQRAEAVRQALLRRGVRGSRIRTVSYGNAYRLRPCTNCGPADFAVNNRLEARVIK
ncbi:OmpA family protein [Neolewinella persica]|uniref:OmpA family protein n=1 Tax=Neolewinella persica TaxID=70998 RepID=UPI00039F1F88|nr:OmpA family protein [Neolewinella persica]